MFKKLGKNKPLYIVLLIFFTFIFVLASFTNVMADGLSYTPSAPYGPSEGFVNKEYTFRIYTSSAGSHWMFDWGDGTQTDWIKVQESYTSINQTHTWGSEGEYQIKVKHRTANLVESYWSTPLSITIYLDTDFDGWIDNIENSYQTDVTDPSDYPLDTDGDGTPDADSQDGIYIGDINDDDDYLIDSVEETLGTNPKDAYDVFLLNIDGTDHYLLDTDIDEDFDLFYNNNTGNTTALGVDDDLYVVDFNGDNVWDYTYDISSATLSVYTQEEEKPAFEIPIWLVLAISIPLTIFIVVFLLLRLGVIYTYEVQEEEKFDEYEEIDVVDDL